MATGALPFLIDTAGNAANAYGSITWWDDLMHVIVQGNPNEAATAYRDTIGDLMASLGGSVLGAALVTTLLWRVGDPRRPSDALVPNRQ